MRLILSGIFLCLIAFACKESEVYMFAYFKGNGEDGLHLAVSEDGLQWKALKGDSSFLQPQLSPDKLMRDPCIVQGVDGLFHMVWTISWHEKGIGYASSPDLIHWSEQILVPVFENTEGVKNCWAPEITYDPIQKEYMIYWASTIENKFMETAGPEEGGLNHRLYAVTTKDFKTFSETRLLYDYGFNVIDAAIYFYNGKFIMFMKDETPNPPQKNICLAYADRLTGPYSAPSGPITGNYWAEGPTALHKDESWIVYFDKYTEGKYGAVKSDDLRHWNDISNQISFPEGTRHGTVFSVKKSVVDNISKY